MPVVRGRFVPEIENTGRVKRCFDILLWGSQWQKRNAIDLDQVESLRDYLRSLTPRFCGIRLLYEVVRRFASVCRVAHKVDVEL